MDRGQVGGVVPCDVTEADDKVAGSVDIGGVEAALEQTLGAAEAAVFQAGTRTHTSANLDVAGGKELFELNCSSCHGPVANGSDLGPPLVDIIYEPGHHADVAFVLAVRNGVRAHHWRFGDMPPLPGVTEPMVQEIVGYVRWLQRQVGIE